MSLNLVLEERRVTFFCFLLLIQQQFSQENGVLSLILLQLLVKNLVLLDLIIEHSSHLIQLRDIIQILEILTLSFSSLFCVCIFLTSYFIYPNSAFFLSLHFCADFLFYTSLW